MLTPNEDFIYAAAFRYALGRATYAPTIVTEEIKAHIDEFPKHSLKLFIREIDQAASLGWECDRDTWINFRNFLEDYLKKNSS